MTTTTDALVASLDIDTKRPSPNGASPDGRTTDGEQPLLTDDEIFSFINRGYCLIETVFPDAFHAEICREIAALTEEPGNAILDRVPKLGEIYAHPAVRGALASLLGADYAMNGHRHCHVNPPGARSQNWHQDGTNVRHHQIRTVLAMYYPQDVTLDMGPTMIVPGTHFRNAPTDRMATYANIRGQVALAVKAGSVAITHYDLWHAASRNKSDRTRYMLKFLFDRQSDPAGPSWAHDPESAGDVVRRRVGEMIGPDTFYNSDLYKEWELRRGMWNWLLGTGGAVPSGGFKDMLAG